jgi:hypothetical protein
MRSVLNNFIQKRFLFDSFRPHYNKEIPTIFDVRKQLQERVGYEEIYNSSSADKQHLANYKINSQSELPAQRMHVSYAEAIIPLGNY